jgi:hypothetical protein
VYKDKCNIKHFDDLSPVETDLIKREEWFYRLEAVFGGRFKKPLIVVSSLVS